MDVHEKIDNYLYHDDFDFYYDFCEDNFKDIVPSRIEYLALAPQAVFAIAADSLIGLGTGLAAIATGGMFSALNNRAFEHLSCRGHITAPYRALIRTINPNAQFANYYNNDLRIHRLYDKMFGEMEGITTVVEKCANKFSKSENFLKRHVAARLSYALVGMATTVAIVARGVIGAIAIPLSFVSLGKHETLNFMADESLKTPNIIDTLFCTILLTINPWIDSR
jgi:hypothetical protein